MLVTKNGPIAHHDHISSTTSVSNICCQKYHMFNQNICCSEWLTCEIVITKAKICPITQNGTMIIVGIERSWSISITQSDLFMIYHVLRFMKLITCQKNIICSYIPMLWKTISSEHPLVFGDNPLETWSCHLDEPSKGSIDRSFAHWTTHRTLTLRFFSPISFGFFKGGFRAVRGVH